MQKETKFHWKQFKTSVLLFVFLLFSAAIQAQLDADFSTSTTEGCAPFIVKLVDNSTGGATSWKWTSSAGVSSNKQNPTLIFPNAGVFSITLEISDGSGTNTHTKDGYIRVIPGLTADFSVINSNGCAPFTTTLNDLSVPQSSPIVDWFWSFGNGIISTEQNPTVTFDQAENFDVLLKVTDGNGCEAALNKEDFIQVERPTASFLFDSVICSLPADVTFLNTSEGNNLNYLWDFGNGTTSNQQIPGVIQYLAHDTLTVQLKVEEQGSACTDSISKTLYIKDYEPLFDIDVVCTDTNFTFTVTDQTVPTPATVHWNFGDGTESALSTVSHSYANKLEKTLVLTTSLSSSCVNTKTLTYTPPIALFTSNSSIVCENPFPVDFTNLSTGLGLTYEWDFSDSTYSSLENPSHDFTIPPLAFSPKLQVTDTFNCIASYSALQEVPVPEAHVISLNNKLKGCAPLTVNFLDSVITVSSSIKKYSWDFGDPASGTANFSNDSTPDHTYSEPGLYDVTFIVELENGCSDTIVKSDFISVGAAPDQLDFDINFSDTICYGKSLNFVGLASYNNPTYFADYFCWSFEDKIDPLLANNETPPADCPNGPSGYLPTDKIAHAQTPTHLFANYEYTNGSNANGYNYIGEVKEDAELLFTHLISGFNGCYKEEVKPVYVHPTVAMPGFAFDDFDFNLTACDTNKTIGIYNASKNYDSLVYFHIVHVPTKDTVQKINENDTVFYRFNQQGDYAIEIAVYNKTTKCTDEARRTFQVLIDTLKFNLPDTICKNEQIIAFDQSIFSTGFVSERSWSFNGAVESSESFPSVNNDTLKITANDTGWNYILLERKQRVFDSLLIPQSISSECAYSIKDSIYVHGIEFILELDEVIMCGKDSVKLKNKSTSTSPQNSIEWTLNATGQILGITDSLTFTDSVPGTYSFQAKITNNYGCVDSANTADLLISLPLLSFTAADTVVCENDLINFKNNSVANNAAYTWTIEGSTYSNIDALHQFSNPGNFDVKLHAIDQYNCEDSITSSNLVRIAPYPISEFKALELIANCPPYSIQFLDTSSIKGTTWEWKIENQAAPTQNYLHTFIHPGKYDVEFTSASPEGCSNTIVKTDYIEIKGPAATATFSSLQLCAPDTAIFEMDFKDTEYYVWDFKDGTIESAAVAQQKDTVRHEYTIGGVFKPVLTIIDSNDCGIEVTGLSDLQVDLILADFKGKDSIACQLDSLSFINLSSSYFDADYDWNFGDGTTASDSTPTHTFPAEGTYTVKLTATSNIGCRDSSSIMYNTFASPAQQLTVSNPYFCVPVETDYELTFNNSLFTPTDVYFTINGTQFNGTTASHSYTVAKDYPISYTIVYGNSACKIDSTFLESYYELPVANFDYLPKNLTVSSNAVNFENNSENATIFNWNFGNSKTSSAENPINSYTSPKNYTVSLVVSNEGGCKDSITQKIPVAPGELIRLPNAFSPNGDGYNDTYGILYAGDLNILNFSIYNRWGELLFETSGIDDRWDGTYKGQLVQQDTYIYHIRGELKNGESKIYKGNFSLIR